MHVYLVADRGYDYCTHERVYATREQALNNVADGHKRQYATYLAQHAKDIRHTVPGTDPTPQSFDAWLESHHGLVIEELELVGLPGAPE